MRKKQSIPAKLVALRQVDLTQNLLIKGFTLHQNGDLHGANQYYSKVLKVQPLNFDALHLSGLVASNMGNNKLAVELIKKAITIKPNDPAARSNLGIAYFNLGEYGNAIDSYSLALELKPEYEDAIYNKAVALQKLERVEEAISSYECVVQLNPKHVGALTNLGNVLQKEGEFERALEKYNQAISVGLSFAEPYNNRGNLYNELQMYQASLADFSKALEINPDYAEAYNNQGNALHSLQMHSLAMVSYNKAISLKHDYAEAHHNRGNLHKELQNYDDALLDFNKALELRPDYEFLEGVRLSTKMHICNWENFEKEWERLQQKIIRGEKASPPFLLLPLTDSLDLQKKASEIWVKAKHSAVNCSISTLRTRVEKKIKVGYFSADYHEHATMYLMAQLFELHDRNKFEIVGFSFGPDQKDAMRARAVIAMNQFYDVRNKTDKEVAKLSRGLGIDIAVDLKGFTLNSRAGIFAHRAAPIQVNYLGYPGTMGAEFIDFIIADRVVIPENLKHIYSEKVLYMPNCYQVNDQKRSISSKVFTREEVGLPATGFVYCCFNNNYKITPTIFKVWMRILFEVKDSVLWLLEDNESAANSLRLQAKIHGVNPARLVFAKRMPLPEHLARHNLADLFIDTIPCNAHTTASDALWSGLPVLTCIGEAFASRVAASLVISMGLSELVTNDLAEYESLAINLGVNPNKVKNIKYSLVSNTSHSPLFDSIGYTKNLEDLYQSIYSQYSE
jgi:predicted O-linked N-acetylglucosamine transferase (SPINDLY family)